MLSGTLAAAPRVPSPSLEPEGGAGKGRGGACARAFLYLWSPEESAQSLRCSVQAVRDSARPEGKKRHSDDARIGCPMCSPQGSVILMSS